MTSSASIAAIVLAAGQSKRYGGVKLVQKSPSGRVLIDNTVEVVEKAGCHPIVVVTGAYQDQIAAAVRAHSALLVHNTNWAEGMGSSIACGAKFLNNMPAHPAAVIVATADQPLLTADVLLKMIALYFSQSPMAICCDYGTSSGPPVLFDFSLIEELSELKGDTGARQVLMRYSEMVLSIPFPEGKLDIDRPEDWNQIIL